MSEAKTIQETPTPRTRDSLADDLRQLGVKPGMVLLVHSSMRALGWVSGGAVAAIQALQDVLTKEGTLVMPTHSGGLSDPAHWENPPVPADWVPIIRETMPAFDPQLTPTRQMGAMSELFRTWPDVVRSNHPQNSFAAWGRYAPEITANQSLALTMGEQSPLARIYDFAGYVLLLGVTYANNTSFHLAEYRLSQPVMMTAGAPIFRKGVRIWATFEDVDLDEEDFPQIGLAYEAVGPVTIGQVGSAESRLFPQPSAVDFALDWMEKNRKRIDESDV